MITEQVAAQAVPVLGVVAGAAINTMFMDFYQDTAKGHFTIKRLEALHGEQVVRDADVGLLEKR